MSSIADSAVRFPSLCRPAAARPPEESPMKGVPTTRPAPWAVPLFAAACLCCCLTFFPGRSDARSVADAATTQAAVQYAPFLPGDGMPQPLVMGGRDEAALGSRNEPGNGSTGDGSTGEGSAADNIFSGSFVGALLFGYPFTGVGGADLALLAFAGLLVFRVVARRSLSGRDDGRFNVRDRERPGARLPGDGNTPGNAPGDGPRRNGPDRGNDAGNGRRGQPKEPSGDPRDNAWTRRMGGPSGNSPKNSPWSASGNAERPTVTAKDRAAAMWAHLSSEGQGADKSGGGPEAAVAEGARVPQDFDVNDFLDGARALYVRLQEFWGRRELAGLEDFLSPEMMAQLRKQAEKHPEAVPVNVMLVEATLKDMEAENGEESARVLFKALIRTGDEEQPSEVREEWLFRRGGGSGGMWRLSGIGAISE